MTMQQTTSLGCKELLHTKGIHLLRLIISPLAGFKGSRCLYGFRTAESDFPNGR